MLGFLFYNVCWVIWNVYFPLLSFMRLKPWGYWESKRSILAMFLRAYRRSLVWKSFFFLWLRSRPSSRTFFWLWAIFSINYLCSSYSSAMFSLFFLSWLSFNWLSPSSLICSMTYILRSYCYLLSSACLFSFIIRFHRAYSFLALSFFYCSASALACSSFTLWRLYLNTNEPLVNESHILRAHSIKFSYFICYSHLTSRSLSSLCRPCYASSSVMSYSINCLTANISIVFSPNWGLESFSLPVASDY